MVGERIRGAVEAMGLKHERNPHRVVTISVGCCSVVPQTQGSSDALVGRRPIRPSTRQKQVEETAWKRTRRQRRRKLKPSLQQEPELET